LHAISSISVGDACVMAASDRNRRTLQLGRAQQGAARPDQLRALGWTTSEIRTRITRGEWHRRHTGVLILGDPGLLPLVEEAAALLALGKRAVLSHRTAAVLWGLADAPDERLVHVSLVARSGRPRDGIRIHLVHSLDAKDVCRRHNLRLTSPARTVIDHATDATSSELEHATSEAVAKRLMTDAELDQALGRAPDNHSGAARLRARLMYDPEFLLHTRSVAERIAYPLILEAGLPRPALNERVHGELVDLHWPEHKVIV
jgi:hypothetical protein